MSTPSIVVVDDSRAIQSIVTRVLKGSHLRDASIHGFSCGQAALQYVSENGADLVITDWHMPGMSGIELIQAVRLRSTGRIKVGMVTSEIDRERLHSAEQHGVAFIVNKPFTERALLDAVNGALGTGDAPDGSPPGPGRPADAEGASSDRAARPDAPRHGSSPLAEPRQDDTQHVLQEGLARHFRPIRLRLSPGPAEFDEMVLLTMLVRADGRPAKLAVLDLRTVVMLAAGALQTPPGIVRPMMGRPNPGPEAVAQVERFLKSIAPRIAPDTVKVQSNFVSSTMPKLRDRFARPEWSRTFKLQVPGYGEGLLALLEP
ncbi:MAG: response regulator [Burkholderiales bacterium]|jgi:CheY-like chemotaxis protein